MGFKRVVVMIASDDMSIHQQFMRHAFDQAVQAFDVDEVPVGAIVVHDFHIIAAAHNQREMLRDPTAHAEMIAITQAAESLGSWRLEDCTLYVTLEPCVMCSGAILQARIPRVVYGASDEKAGAVNSLFSLLDDSRLNHRVEVISGIHSTECGQILTEFFREQRRQGKK